MAFRKIPKKFDAEQMAADLKTLLVYSEHYPDTIVSRIAAELGVARRTVYDVLDGRIKVSLDFLHACVIATNGDPEVKKYLEPEGFELITSAASLGPVADSCEAECVDDLPPMAAFHTVVMHSKNPRDVMLAYQVLLDEIRQDLVAWEKRTGKDLAL